MTQTLDRPPTEVPVRSATETLPRPTEVEREEIRQPLPPEAPPRMFRWLGWLLGLAAIAAVSWLVIAEITSDEPVTSVPSYVVTEPGAVTADPKLLTPVVTPPLVGDVTHPGDVSLTDLMNAGITPAAAAMPEATTWPWIYWMPPYQEVNFMEEATVSPTIYEARAAAQPTWTLESYLNFGSLDIMPALSALPGVYWSPRVVMDTDTAFPEGMDLSPGMFWPVLNQPDWTLDTYELISTVPSQPFYTSASHGGHLNTMR